jgi:hypothetical protein
MTYYGRIMLKSGGQPVRVQVDAGSPGQAKAIVEAQYSGQMKGWARQMSTSIG